MVGNGGGGGGSRPPDPPAGSAMIQPTCHSGSGDSDPCYISARRALSSMPHPCSLDMPERKTNLFTWDCHRCPFLYYTSLDNHTNNDRAS